MEHPDDVILVYITAANTDEARRIGRELVVQRIAACANVIDSVTSCYWWEGAVQEESEAALVVKTKSALFDRLADKVRELHSYSCPCIVAFPVTAGNSAFLEWIRSETID